MEKKDTKRRNLFARVKPANHDWLKQVAEEFNMSVSEWVDTHIEELRESSAYSKIGVAKRSPKKKAKKTKRKTRK